MMLYVAAGVGPEGARGARNWASMLTPLGVWISGICCIVSFVLLWGTYDASIQDMATWLPAAVFGGSLVSGGVIYCVQTELQIRRERQKYTRQ